MSTFSWKARLGAPRAHIAYAFMLTVALIVAVDFGAFVGTRVIPWDFIDNEYNQYLIALQSASHNVFGVYNPYMLGGMFVKNIAGFYDPSYWLPLIFHAYPDIYQHQLIHLAHFFVIPASLFFLAHLYGTRGKNFYLVAVLSVVAAYVGPTFALVSQGGESEAYIWGFALIAALESYRIKGNRWSMVAAALFVSWAAIAEGEDISFWPLALLAYAIAFWPELRTRRFFPIDVATGLVIAITLTTPFLIEEFHLFQYLVITKHATVVEMAQLGDITGYFGYHGGPSMFIFPAALGILFVASLWKLEARQRWVFGGLLTVLYLYALGDLTPVEGVFRTIYFPASLFRRPYGALDIALPITFALIVRGYLASSTASLVGRNWILACTTAAVVASFVLQPKHITLNLLAYLLTVVAVIKFQSRVIVAGILLVQWFALVFLPMRASEFYPTPWPPPQFLYFNTYKPVAKYLSPITTDSDRLFRVAGIGVTADFGYKSGVYRYYMLYPGHGTVVPRGLATVLDAPEIPNDVEGTRNLTAETIIGTVTANPKTMVGSSAVRQMAVRYYILGQSASSLLPAILRMHPEFKVLPGGFWTALYDPKAEPFVRTIDSAERVTAARADVDWDRVTAAIPAGARFLDVADLYDSWWHATSSNGDNLPIVDNHGELRVVVSGQGGQQVLLRFENRWLTLALIFEAVVYSMILCAGAFATWRLLRLRLSVNAVGNRDEHRT